MGWVWNWQRTDFFEDMECESRLEDMLSDAKEQYLDYSEFALCPMWGMFLKELSV